LVDAERAGARLQRLEELLERLDEVREEGEGAYLSDAVVRAATERRLEMAVQICIDIGTQLAAERSVRPPDSYADVFGKLAEAGLLTSELARGLSEAARQRNLLVHLYMDIEDRKVFASLGSLDDLREFAKVVEAQLD
jgi:uncharacterized protein YutE (UPF0331/DUF86 family)